MTVASPVLGRALLGEFLCVFLPPGRTFPGVLRRLACGLVRPEAPAERTVCGILVGISRLSQAVEPPTAAATGLLSFSPPAPWFGSRDRIRRPGHGWCMGGLVRPKGPSCSLERPLSSLCFNFNIPKTADGEVVFARPPVRRKGLRPESEKSAMQQRGLTPAIVGASVRPCRPGPGWM